MIKFEDSEIIQILPSILRNDPETQAISYAIACEIKRILEYSRKISVYASVDRLSEEFLDLLATELRSPYYDAGMDIQIKRDIIKRTIQWYYTAGTPSAVEELVKTIFGEGEVEEWFEYGGEPYYFRIKTNAALTPEANHVFEDMIKKVKNVRSHLERVVTSRRLDEMSYYGVGIVSRTKMAPIYQEGSDYHASVI